MEFTKLYLFDESNDHFLIYELKRTIVYDLLSIDVFLLHWFFLCGDIKSAYIPIPTNCEIETKRRGFYDRSVNFFDIFSCKNP